MISDLLRKDDLATHTETDGLEHRKQRVLKDCLTMWYRLEYQNLKSYHWVHFGHVIQMPFKFVPRTSSTTNAIGLDKLKISAYNCKCFLTHQF